MEMGKLVFANDQTKYNGGLILALVGFYVLLDLSNLNTRYKPAHFTRMLAMMTSLAFTAPPLGEC